MSDDLDLASAFRAAKEEYDGHSPDADLTLQRALFATRRDTRRRKVAQWVVIPLAAALAASTAWAGATGRLAPVMHGLSDAFHGSAPSPAPHLPASDHAPVATSAADANTNAADDPTTQGRLANADPSAARDATIRAGADPNAVASATGAASAPPKNGVANADPNAARNAAIRADADPHAIALTAGASSAPPRNGVANDDPNAAGGAAIRAGADPTAPARAVASADAGAPGSAASVREQQLFAEANRIHFVERDPARALTAWNRYLAEAPSGVLAPEARYNRALTLVRLGRTVEARTELQHFANGTYRAAEARALLEAIARDAGAP